MTLKTKFLMPKKVFKNRLYFLDRIGSITIGTLGGIPRFLKVKDIHNNTPQGSTMPRIQVKENDR